LLSDGARFPEFVDIPRSRQSPRHHHIQDHEVLRILPQELNGFLTALDQTDLVSKLLENLPGDFTLDFVIIDNKYRFRAAGSMIEFMFSRIFSGYREVKVKRRSMADFAAQIKVAVVIFYDGINNTQTKSGTMSLVGALG
jgi:hypothetical protein